MEIYALPEKEFRMILLKKFSELWENTGRQLNEIRKTMYKQNKKFNKEMATIKKENTKKQINRNPRVETHNNWTEEFNRVSKVDLSMQKKESVNWR